MRRRIILINNGYPTIKSPNRSTYIKSITECLVALGLDVELNVLIDDFANTKQKIVRYLVFYKDLLIKKFCVEDLLFIHHVPFVIIPLFFKKISCRDVIIN